MLCALCGEIACRQARETAAILYRFDDQFSAAAKVSASNTTASSQMSPRIVWDFNEPKTNWKLLRGRMGFRPGELALRGEGSTPVIVSPEETAIDWSRYESVLIRMIQEGGHEIKIKIGRRELKQKLGPRMQYRVYKFDLNINEPTYNVPLAVMPTDDLNGIASIDFIEIVPRKARFSQPAGRQVIGKREEYRNALYVQSPSSVAYEVSVPKEGRLHFGIGVTEKNKPVTFRILAGGSQTELFSKKVADPDVWADAEVDLRPYGGRNTKLVFQTDTDTPGAVGFWANPLLITPGPKSRPNVLVYLICSLRPDHTSLYGYSRATTPFLKELGTSSVVFDDAQAQASWTKASVPALMTSLHAYTLGIADEMDSIPKGTKTFAERMRAAGYVTASVVTSPFAGRVSGLERGFDYMMEYPVVHRVRKEETDRGTDSAALNKVVFPWLERHRDEPFFLYLHATDPHAPYRPPAPFEEKWAHPGETERFNQAYARLLDFPQYGGGAAASRANCATKGISPDWFIREAIDRYDGEIAHNDNSLKMLVDKLNGLGVLDNTLLVVVSDHGEEFWDHGWTAHGHSLYQELIHCVFLMSNRKLLPVPRRITDPVQLIDLMPTVLDLLNLPVDGVVEGESLAPLLKGLPFQRKSPVVSSRLASPHAKPTGLVPEFRTGTFAIVDAGWKLVWRDKAKLAGLNEVELYDRTTDRREQKNVATEHPRVVERMRAELKQWITAQEQVKGMLGQVAKISLDQKTMENLRSLGYLGGKTNIK